MDGISLIADTITIATQQSIGFAKFLLHRQTLVSAGILGVSDQSAGVLHISSAIFDAVAPPPVKPNRHKTSRRTDLRKKRRTRRKSYSDDGGEEYGFYGGDGDGDGPLSGAGGSWGGGRGWNFDRFGGQNWDESAWFSSSDFAYEFVYEVICWIALSNCVHFAFKKLVRFLADTEREKC